MSDESRSIRVSIFGRDYSVKGGSDDDYIRTLAAHVDSIMRDVSDKTGVPSPGRVAILAALNIADELFEERRNFRDFVTELAQDLEEAMSSGSEKSG